MAFVWPPVESSAGFTLDPSDGYRSWQTTVLDVSYGDWGGYVEVENPHICDHSSFTAPVRTWNQYGRDRTVWAAGMRDILGTPLSEGFAEVPTEDLLDPLPVHEFDGEFTFRVFGSSSMSSYDECLATGCLWLSGEAAGIVTTEGAATLGLRIYGTAALRVIDANGVTLLDAIVDQPDDIEVAVADSPDVGVLVDSWPSCDDPGTNIDRIWGNPVSSLPEGFTDNTAAGMCETWCDTLSDCEIFDDASCESICRRDFWWRPRRGEPEPNCDPELRQWLACDKAAYHTVFDCPTDTTDWSVHLDGVCQAERAAFEACTSGLPTPVPPP